MGDPYALGFGAGLSLYLAFVCAFLVAALAGWNAVADPTCARLQSRDEVDYVTPADETQSLAPPA
jgi:hypothetical protein